MCQNVPAFMILRLLKSDLLKVKSFMIGSLLMSIKIVTFKYHLKDSV